MFEIFQVYEKMFCGFVYASNWFDFQKQKIAQDGDEVMKM